MDACLDDDKAYKHNEFSRFALLKGSCWSDSSKLFDPDSELPQVARELLARPLCLTFL
jgi:hypothetical protein